MGHDLAEAIGLPHPRDVDAIASDVRALVEANAPDVNAVQILLSARTPAPSSRRSLRTSTCTSPRVVAG